MKLHFCELSKKLDYSVIPAEVGVAQLLFQAFETVRQECPTHY